MSLSRSKLLLLAGGILSFSLSSVSPVLADVFFWKDHQTKVSMTFPDRWRMVHTQKPDEVLHIRAPGRNDYAGCRMRVSDDRRFLIYPRKLDAQIQRVHVSRRFWEDYVGQFNESALIETLDNSGLGLGFASFAQASFVSTTGPKVEKRALMMASVYNGKRYVFECSAEKEAYARWYRPFLSILKSVQFRQERFAHPAGQYRNFTADTPLHIYGARPSDLYVY